MMSSADAVQAVAGLLFAVGVFGVLSRRNLIIMLMSVELMLNAANLSLVGFAREMAHLPGKSDGGQAMVLMAMAVAAAEVAVGLSILIALFRHVRSVSVDHPQTATLRD